MEQLAVSMRRSKNAGVPLTSIQGNAPPAVAFTYFGQFVDHDLTFDSTPLREAGDCAPALTINHRTAWLDLDHVYGDGPGSERHHHLYESDEASFRIGHSAFGGEPFDIPFTDIGEPKIADDRNSENVMLRQIHALFLKLHNLAVRDLPITLPPRERFKRARDRVRWQYQWLVRKWYLPEICATDTYAEVVLQGNRLIDWESTGFAIPVEFATATMRFGHSMVRAEYRLNDRPKKEGGSGPVPLAQLFGNRNNGPLPPRLRIDWTHFSKPTNSANSIDTSMVEPLFKLPDEHIDLYARSPMPHPPHALAMRTLLRGSAIRLATGQQVADALGEPRLVAAPEDQRPSLWTDLRDIGMAEDTPLWYYILLEAEQVNSGARLGRVGSRIVAEVIEGSLQSDPNSIARLKPREWVPEPWTSPIGVAVAVQTLRDVAQAVGL